MKVCALVVLLVCCIAQNASADWRSDVKISHYEHINSIVNDTLLMVYPIALYQHVIKYQKILTKLDDESDSQNDTPANKRCYEEARQTLRTASFNGYSKVDACVREASTAGNANVCAQQVDTEVFNISLEVSRAARACVANP
ncbi:hypothetical protein TSAR_002112 [Trichomalopsis sarcophagae]|uniref:Protein TsetseEP domain-containing protein n=1 Tax=Trichomalopsis sarcophagae TaxID=543379 RepID=A0A232FGP5_9HYME|nr:hypothetical protein TSAR_002112 [Trichomalopsis sarcophagae]